MTVLKAFKPRRAKHASSRQRRVYVLIALCGLYEELLTIITLGHFTVDTRAHALFDWFVDE